MAELLSKKNAMSSKAKRLKLTARLSTKALVATPCRFCALPVPLNILVILRSRPWLLELLLPPMLIATVCMSNKTPYAARPPPCGGQSTRKPSTRFEQPLCVKILVSPKTVLVLSQRGAGSKDNRNAPCTSLLSERRKWRTGSTEAAAVETEV